MNFNEDYNVPQKAEQAQPPKVDGMDFDEYSQRFGIIAALAQDAFDIPLLDSVELDEAKCISASKKRNWT